MAVINVNKNNFEELKQSGRPVLLDFHALWCGPCRMLSKVIDEIASEREDVLIGKVNIDEERELAESFGVMSVPTLIVLKDSEEINRSVGFKPKNSILSMI